MTTIDEYMYISTCMLNRANIPQLGNVHQEKIPPVQWPDLNGEMRRHPKVKKKVCFSKEI